jgi:hypothetical protein
MKITKSIFILLSGIIFLSGCKKDKADAPAPKPKDVYVAGYEVNTNFTDGQATYWKNGTKVNLPTTTGSFSDAQSIFVTNDAVYIAGKDNAEGVVYWKNGTKIKLAGFPEALNTGGIFVAGNDVYLCGSVRENLTSSTSIACYWKNGVKHNLGVAGLFSDASAIAVNGNDVYVTGTQYGPGGFSGYWKNGVPVNLSAGQYEARVESIFISGNDVYLSGYIEENNHDKAAYWKNNTLVLLHDLPVNNYSNAASIYVNDGVVYVAGSEQEIINTGNYTPVYWVNGIKKYLPHSPNTTEQALSIYVYGKDVYIAGRDNQLQKPVLWKNEERIVLEHAGRASASCVFVK